MKNLFTSNASSPGIVFTSSTGASQYSLAGSSSGNVGIGTINPSQKLTIYSNGSVGMSGTASRQLDIFDPIRQEILRKFFDIIIDASPKFDGKSAAKIYELLENCGGGSNDNILDTFVRFKDAFIERKVNKKLEIELYNLFVEQIQNTWGFDLRHEINIFERIDG